MIDRRSVISRGAMLLAGTTLAGCTEMGGAAPSTAAATASTLKLPTFFEDLERRTFNYFWERVNRRNGLVPDRWPSDSFCSIAAVGFGLTAYPIGVERGWCSRADARDLTLTTLRFFWNEPQGPDATGYMGYKGFFYHFVDMETGHRYQKVDLSTVDSTILFMGMLFAASYFDRDDPGEAEIRDLAAKIYARADWTFFRRDGFKGISMGYHPEYGLIDRNWDGFNEAMFVNILALGAPNPAYRVDDAWEAWIEPYERFWRGSGETRHVAFAPLFGHQYSHVWIDFRGIKDSVMRGETGLDYFENSRRATYANRAFCIANPMQWDGYSKDIWGLTACDGPGNYELPFKGEQRTFYGYAARGPLGQPDERDDGTIAPTAALGSLPFAPEIVIPCVEAMKTAFDGKLYSQYGFLDAFNPSFKYTDKKVERGVVDAKHGWHDTDYIAIDQGPILTMAANYQSDFVWKYMRKVPAIRDGLKRAGFTGGWLNE